MAEWMKPRTVFALMIYGGFVYGFVSKLINPDAMIAAFSTIVGFHFGERGIRKAMELKDKE